MDPHDNSLDTPDGEISTRVSRRLAWVITAAFMSAIAAVPLVQIAVEITRHERPGITRLAPAGAMPTGRELADFGDALRDDSVAASAVRPGLRSFLADVGGRGGGSVIVGSDGWLYFAPGVRAVIGRGFLDDAPVAPAVRAFDDAPRRPADRRVSDPRPAIRAFAERVRQAGGELVLLPVPDKSGFYPQSTRTPAARNASFAALADELRRDDIEVIDIADLPQPPGAKRFLSNDTHWTPQWMGAVARQLATVARRHGVDVAPQRLRATDVTVSAEGDLAELLSLPPGRAEAVTIRRVTHDGDARLRPDRSAPVLLVGDSFTNIYSTPEMGWGDSAGLAEQLSYELGGPIDWVARNDAGAVATRDVLARERSTGADRLAGKRVVIWAFADRELVHGDWRLVD